MLDQIFNEDCLETMSRMPDNYVDLVLTDPPYGIGAEIYRENKARGALASRTKYSVSVTEWDSAIPSAEVFKEIFRVSKHQIIFGGNYFTQYLPPSSSWIVWDKVNGNNKFADCELAWTSHTKAVRLKRHMWNGMLQEDMKQKELRYHPTQKPLPLMRWCLASYAKEGDIIYDPFMGSGTTARACLDLGFNFIGSETSESYCKIAEQRLRQTVLL